jgi:hypothetical protein
MQNELEKNIFGSYIKKSIILLAAAVKVENEKDRYIDRRR